MQPGQPIKVESGHFKGFQGTVIEVRGESVRARILMFGTEVELELPLCDVVPPTPEERVQKARDAIVADSGRWVDVECYQWWRERVAVESSPEADRKAFEAFFAALQAAEAGALRGRMDDFEAWAPSIAPDELEAAMLALGARFLPARARLRALNERWRQDPDELSRFSASQKAGKQRRDLAGQLSWKPRE